MRTWEPEFRFGLTKNHIFVLQWPSLSPQHWPQHLWVGGGAKLVGDGFSRGEQERQVFESPDTHLQLWCLWSSIEMWWNKTLVFKPKGSLENCHVKYNFKSSYMAFSLKSSCCKSTSFLQKEQFQCCSAGKPNSPSCPLNSCRWDTCSGCCFCSTDHLEITWKSP